MKPCEIESCRNNARPGRPLCNAHAARKRKGMDMDAPVRPWRRDAPARLATEVMRAPSGCLEWQGGRTTGGYGILRHDGANWYAHRLAWVLAHGPIPPGLFVCHSCDNRRCVEVGHLWLGTVADNAADMVSKGRGRGRHSAPIPGP